MDNIASWNIRGLNWPNKQEDVKLFLHINNIGLVGLLETKIIWGILPMDKQDNLELY